MDLGMIGKRIKAAREAAGMTQEELAEVLDMSTTHISVLERGVKPPKLETLIRIANVLQVSADTLLQDVVTYSAVGVANDVVRSISDMPEKERTRIINAIKALTE